MRQWDRSSLVHLWLVAYSVPSHYLNQCWLLVNQILRKTFHWSFIGNSKFSSKNMHLKISPEKCCPSCLDFNVWTKCPTSNDAANCIETNKLPTSQTRSVIICWVVVAWCVLSHDLILEPFSHCRVHMVVADGLTPIWHQDICNHRDDGGKWENISVIHVQLNREYSRRLKR